MTDAQNSLRLPWRADGVFVLNCDGDPVATADTKREAATIVNAVNRYEALVVALRNLLADTQHAEHNCGDEDCPVAKARAYIAHLRPQIEAAAREAALREAANRALLSVSAIRSVCDMHGAVSCSLQNQGKDCLCQEREEQAEYINQKILALIKKEPTNAV